ncbi:GyrI-like domain-containing protein [Agrococcus carbonis]|uniref:Effector-binding domain-containing protein n=1 Tax=Agrococcus carbonis TaxID=684552 RepID=A0A1H1LM28_9MICO|nr:GyrI-like domain-containing protein [Agrococcus carbonis]SDR75578.1 effector-binding domain-containing protein [Agrococcus carbonis]
MVTEGAPEIVELERTTIAAIRETVPMAEITAFFDRAFGTLMRVLQSQGLAPAGPPVGVYWSMPTDRVDVSVGFPTAREAVPAGGVAPEHLPGGRALQLTHVGSYDSMTRSYDRMVRWAGERSLELGPMMWETYLTEPSPEGDASAARTLITWPLRDDA